MLHSGQSALNNQPSMPATANRIDAHFAQLRADGKRAFVAYVCAGDPTLDATIDIVLALERAGVDIVESDWPDDVTIPGALDER